MKKFLATLVVIAVVVFAVPAFAANPFQDVPVGHWSYDAVAQLAARGIISAYPNGAFKGAQPATRYEMASVVARSLAVVDTEKASKKDLEMLKKLVMEFKDELDALGVAADGVDKRVAVLEDRLGGWKLRGTLRIDAKFANSDNTTNWTGDVNTDKEFTKEKFRLFLSKQIDENTSFETHYRAGAWASGQSGSKEHQGKGESTQQSWNKVFITTKLPHDVRLRLGRFQPDWEGDCGVMNDEDSSFGDWRYDGFEVAKQFGNVAASFIVGRNSSGALRNDIFNESATSMVYAANAKWTPTENFFANLSGYWQEGDKIGDEDRYVRTYAVTTGYKLLPSVELKGIYYHQENSGQGVFSNDSSKALNDKADSWKAIVDIDQDFLKYTSLWIEYKQEDNNFGGNNDKDWVASYSYGTYKENGVFYVRPHNNNTSKYIFVKASQKWNSKWNTWVRYVKADWDTEGLDAAKEMGTGIRFQYTPAIHFEFAYDHVDYGDRTVNTNKGEDDLIIFRTTVNF